MKAEKISDLTTNRLSVYLRCLNELAAAGEKTVSSDTLAQRFHLNSAQIRKDLAYFGEFGVRGVGYYVKELRDHLTKILGLNIKRQVCIVGAGRIGSAVADYYAFKDTNCTITAIFDSDRTRIGKKVNGIKISDVKTFSSAVKKDNIDLAIIAVPAEHAQPVLEMIVEAGIRAVLNVAPVRLKVDGDVKVISLDLTISLESLCFFLAGSGENNAGGVKPNQRGRRKRS
jgi:redox-sensing transcriptional repressor